MTIYSLLQERAAQTPDAVAIAAPGRAPLHYGQLLHRVDRVRDTLTAMGLSRNDPVAVVLPNGPEMAVAFLSIASGFTCAPLNPAYRSREFDFYFSDLKAKALIVEPGSSSPAIASAQKLSLPIVAWREWTDWTPSAAGSAAAGDDDTALMLHTSGTTSRPKMVHLSQAALLASAGNIAATLQLTEKDRCLNVMPLFHIHGLAGALLSSMLAGASVVCSPGFDADQFFSWLESERPTWYTAVPTIHQAVLSCVPEDREALRRIPLRFIRTSSAPLTPRVMQQLEDVFQVPVIQAYGMTEGSHQIASNPLPPRLRKPGSVGLPTGTEVAVHEGEIITRGATVITQYAESSGNSNESSDPHFMDGWLKTGDQGYIDADGYIFLTGRLRETINRGGEKISPLEVDEVLKDHPAVSEAVAFAVPHATLGQDIAAAIVLHDGCSATEADIRRFAADRLSEFKVPRQVFIVERIPRTATGKIQRVGLDQRLGLTLSVEDASPKTPEEKALAEIWSLVLGANAGIHDNFFQLGGDSLQAARIVSRIREAMGVELPVSAFFETPTIAGIAGALMTVRTEFPRLEHAPLPDDGIVPIAYNQEAIWFFDQLNPGNPAYNQPMFLELRGALDRPALERALNEIVRRHTALSSIFPAVDGKPVQRIEPAAPLKLAFTGIRGQSDAEREIETRKIANQEARRPFDLARGPLFRASLLQIEDDRHLLMMTTHHIAFDGWSAAILFTELQKLYDAFSSGRPSPLPELLAQYSDFSRWQRAFAGSDVLKDKLEYWKRQLDGDWPMLSLPSGRIEPAVRSADLHGATETFTLPESLKDKLTALARAEGISLFMVLLSAFHALLHRYSGQENIIVGVPFAGRSLVETEELIGCFINTLPVRADLSGSPSCRELISRVRQTLLEAHANQDMPFERVAAELQVERHGARASLFQFLFQFRDFRDPGEMDQLHVHEYKPDLGASLVDISVAVRPLQNRLECRVEYSTELFEAGSIHRLFQHWKTLLEGFTANPGTRVSHLPMLTGGERHQLLTAWNKTQADYPQEPCLHELFEAQVERTPDAVAAVFETERWTYRELNRRVNQLAHHLIRTGVGPESLVGTCIERSLDMVVGLLAILKAGGAYVPLDAGYPKERLGFMMEDSGIRVLLMHSHLMESLPPHTARVICLDREMDREEIADESEQNPITGVKAENPAYMIYTSGSTGRPKGVVIPHRGIVNHTFWMQQKFQLTADDSIIQKTPFSFDMSVCEFFAPLTAGAQLVLARPGGHQDSAYLIKLITEENITIFQTVPSLLRILLEEEGIDRCTSLRIVFCGGEALSSDLQDRFFRCLPAQLHNLYGPTECSIYATFWTCRRDSGTSVVPIGRPIANTQAYLLDANLQPVPIGAPGELHLGGAGLARGYWNRPDLTAEKFIPDPFADPGSGARLYKTGDLARYLPDGNIEYLGRLDHQVKIRGFRIELGEVENAVRQNPAIRQVAVDIRHDARGDKILAAYITHAGPHAPSIGELRRFLKDRLPDHMTPTSFLFLEEMPLTPSGKLDRKALAVFDASQPAPNPVLAAPRTAAERAVTKIWENVLHREGIGIDDNFFDLGGHSLLATQAASRLRQEFHIELPLRSLFENPTVASLAECIETLQWAGRKYEPGAQDESGEREELTL